MEIIYLFMISLSAVSSSAAAAGAEMLHVIHDQDPRRGDRSLPPGERDFPVYNTQTDATTLLPTVTTQASSDLTSAEIKDYVMLNMNSNTNSAGGGHGASGREDDHDAVSSVLRLIDSQRKNCTPGTELELEGVVDQYGVKKFSAEAHIAFNRANLLTRIWRHSPELFYSTDPTLRNQTEYLLYAAVRTMVELNENIYSAGNCYDWYRYPHYDLFCPYAHRTPTGEILAKDLSFAYEYDDKMEWFGKPKEKGNLAIARGLQAAKNAKSANATNSDYDHVRNSKGLNCFRTLNMTEDILLVNYEDGHWSKPYYDCGGGNIWMMTYTVPFFGFNQTTQQYNFMGTSGIDIDLRRVDIDQCPLKPGSTDKNVFAGSSKCKPTTQCEPISGLGFSRGSYVCRCVLGYYFPDKSAYDNGHAYFNGTIIEQEYEKRQQGLNTSYDFGYVCLPCAEGCTEGCKDATPCIAALNWTLRVAILVAAVIVMACLPVLFYFTFRYAEVKVIKAASPVLLRMVLLGALLLYGPIVVLFPVPTFVTCTTRIWLRGIGFSVSYGALLLKTWRISVVFRVRSAQRVKITDNDLVKRLCLIVAMFASFLTIRTVVSPPEVKVGVTEESLKAFLCTMDYWDYSQAGGELLLLLWGIKLCFVVRKAPSEFNESKFISWAIYNEFLLSLFLNISMLFLTKYADPDLLYIIFFAHSQLTTTVVLVLLFGSKAYLVYKGLGKGSDQPTATNVEQTRSSNKFITKKKDRANIPLTSSSASNTGTTANTDSYRGHLPGHLTPQEIQEEFKRLYLQLELLKSKNMRLGNPHLTKKLHAMTEAAMLPEPAYCSSSPHDYPPPTTVMSASTLLTQHELLRPPTPVTPSSPSCETVELMEDTTTTESSRTKSDETLIPAASCHPHPPVPISRRISNSHSHDTGINAPLLGVGNTCNNNSSTLTAKPELNNHVVQRLHPNHHPPHFDLRNSKKAFEITI